MKLELKKIKVFLSRSEETYCYSAVIYVDGKPTIHVGNSGFGGADDETPDKRFFNNDRLDFDGYQTLYHQVCRYIATTEPKLTLMDGSEIDSTLEIWAHERVGDYLVAKDIKKHLREGVMYEQGGKVWTQKLQPAQRNPTYREALKKALRSKYADGIIFFDELEPQEQLRRYREAS